VGPACRRCRCTPCRVCNDILLLDDGLQQHRGRVVELSNMQCKIACVVVLQGWSGVRGGRALLVARFLAREQQSADCSSSHGRLYDHIERRSDVMARTRPPDKRLNMCTQAFALTPQVVEPPLQPAGGAVQRHGGAPRLRARARQRHPQVPVLHLPGAAQHSVLYCCTLCSVESRRCA
jgi:hypothetical protein